MIDADNHHADTYKDALGRVVKTIYDDGSFTQTIYSVGDQAISGYDLTPTIPAGGSEAIQIAQHKSADTNVPYTIDIYDRGGNLIAVSSPAVADALNSGAMTRPYTQYAYNASGNEIEQIDAIRLDVHERTIEAGHPWPPVGW